MHYKNGNREFKTDFSVQDSRGYYLVTDVSTNLDFFLPEFVIRDMTYAFSWDRYHEDLDKDKLVLALKEELKRLEAISFESVNVDIGKIQMKGFIDELTNRD